MRRNRDMILQEVTTAAAEQARLADEPEPQIAADPQPEDSTAMSPDPTSSAADTAATSEPVEAPEAHPTPARAAVEEQAAPGPPPAVAALLQQPQRRSTLVHGFDVQITEEQAKRGQICTTVYMPIELREAIREAEQLTGRNYQELMRIGIGQLLEQLAQAQ